MAETTSTAIDARAEQAAPVGPPPKSSTRRELATGLSFLAPNILGVLVFVIFPVVFSLGMAFTNWDLTQQNMFKPEASVEFTGLDNLIELTTENRVGDVNADGQTVGLWEAISSSRFLRFFGNTLFFMMGIPLAVGGSLIAAILLSQDTRAGGGRNHAWLIGGGVLLSSCVLLAALGIGASAMVLLVVGTGCGILLMGLAGGLTFYRTVFYTPHFVTGVATFVLWKNLYSKQTGPINNTLQPILDGVSGMVAAVPPGVARSLHFLGYALLLGLFWKLLAILRRMHRDGDLGRIATALSVALLCLPFLAAGLWYATAPTAWILLAAAGTIAIAQTAMALRGGDRFPSTAMEGLGSGLVLSIFAMVGMFILLGLSAVAWYLPGLVEGEVVDGVVVDAPGLEAPSWLNGYHYAKPALMFMGIWGAIGSNNMLLYLAGLSNVPGELYEAADIDGATPLSRFWNVTWPQLAPTTFFIFVMSTIGGLQGGFEAARVMTQGGPAGSTTTLSYFIYQEGFETGRLGFASAVAWVLFLLIFAVTLFNWKFGNKYVD
ncbi:carbohydrate ABC transporter permease [Phycisphaera mikurensis]|uniref:Putative ABC transporter permease protein n=1 Tax=Phycisphaera mikurensis (strain NBRC 102666 / KCTC 22515 / FYK2301M01) TaxID=1142394 RepID=I0IHF9_PHYMF|nr:sugar ABC transporter permease [Phycisphaera mikurensis]MBB6440944.1 multiple sugar transport system permease protein [Phycisphaera mikurensis]BAM04697.1 putative ABC transporter permease protein [Phycisphaera mikurensis NBRC 102666]